jgi:hypothetical protein
MIMSGESCVCPEVWFRDVRSDVERYNATVSDDEKEEATCYATGFATAEYAEKLLALGEEGAAQQLLKQLQKVSPHSWH